MTDGTRLPVDRTGVHVKPSLRAALSVAAVRAARPGGDGAGPGRAAGDQGPPGWSRTGAPAAAARRRLRHEARTSRRPPCRCPARPGCRQAATSTRRGWRCGSAWTARLPRVPASARRCAPLRRSVGAPSPAGSRAAASGCVTSSRRLLRPAAGPIPSPFGAMGRRHEGIDITGAAGSPIAAASAGRVIAAGGRVGYGNMVIVRQCDGLSTVYAHLSRITVSGGGPRAPWSGAWEARGSSTGVQLHFEVRVDGTAVDPLSYAFAGRRSAGWNGASTPGAKRFGFWEGRTTGNWSGRTAAPAARGPARADRRRVDRGVSGSSGDVPMHRMRCISHAVVAGRADPHHVAPWSRDAALEGTVVVRESPLGGMARSGPWTLGLPGRREAAGGGPGPQESSASREPDTSPSAHTTARGAGGGRAVNRQLRSTA